MNSRHAIQTLKSMSRSVRKESLRLRNYGQDGVWGITSYFDPSGRKKRLGNYREFRRRLQVPLVAVELSFDGCFDLGPEDAEILIQIRGGSILWQKERLLNLALQALPKTCDTVAWLDCDTIFLQPDWPCTVRKLLDKFALVQLFERLHHLPPDYHGDTPDVFRSQVPFQSIASCYVKGTLADKSFRTTGLSLRHQYNPGMAWAARRATLELHGLYDALIVGSGDKALVSAAWGRFMDCAKALRLSPRARAHYLAWAEPFYETVRGRVAYLEEDLLHLWHGDLNKRGYANRYPLFSRFMFDPYSDIALTKDGVWHWSSEKPEMHDFIRKRLAGSSPSNESHRVSHSLGA
jgi:hypothetical protein